MNGLDITRDTTNVRINLLILKHDNMALVYGREKDMTVRLVMVMEGRV